MKVCRNPECKERFEPSYSSLQVVCSPRCGIAFARTKQGEEHVQKARRQEKKAKREKVIHDLRWWTKKAQVEFNKFIRLRDAHLPCISCGETKPNIQYAAGHYRTTGACPELRFEELNCHRQCNANCNMHKSGNIGEYRIGLIKRVGLDKVEWIEGPHEAKKYTIDDLTAIREHYRQLNKEFTFSCRE